MRGTIIAIALLVAGPALADGWQTQFKFQARNNRLGVGIPIDHGYRASLSESDHMLLRDTYIESGVMMETSPAAVGPGLYVQAVPVAFLRLRASVQRVVFFGLYNSLIEFDGPEADWSTQALDDLEHKGRLGTAWQGTLQAVIQLKLGPVLALFDNQVQYARADGIDPGKTWYHPNTDLLLDRGDFIHTMKGTLGYLLYGDTKAEFLGIGAHWERYDVRDLDIQRQIAGGMALYRPNTNWWGKPVGILLAGVLVEDVYKQDEFYIGGQIVFTFDHSVK